MLVEAAGLAPLEFSRETNGPFVLALTRIDLTHTIQEIHFNPHESQLWGDNSNLPSCLEYISDCTS